TTIAIPVTSSRQCRVPRALIPCVSLQLSAAVGVSPHPPKQAALPPVFDPFDPYSYAEMWPSRGASRSAAAARRRGQTHVSHETPRVHRAARRRGDRVAGRPLERQTARIFQRPVAALNLPASCR